MITELSILVKGNDVGRKIGNPVSWTTASSISGCAMSDHNNTSGDSSSVIGRLAATDHSNRNYLMLRDSNPLLQTSFYII